MAARVVRWWVWGGGESGVAVGVAWRQEWCGSGSGVVAGVVWCMFAYERVRGVCIVLIDSVKGEFEYESCENDEGIWCELIWVGESDVREVWW